MNQQSNRIPSSGTYLLRIVAMALKTTFFTFENLDFSLNSRPKNANTKFKYQKRNEHQHLCLKQINFSLNKQFKFAYIRKNNRYAQTQRRNEDNISHE